MFDGLLFDLDGTLWDSIDAICVSWNQVLEKRVPRLAGFVTRQKITGCMGMLLPDIVRKLLPELDWAQAQPLMEELLDTENRYVAAHGGVLYPQVPETLALLARDYPLCIVSNCQAGYIEAFFQAHGLGRYFADYENPGRTGKGKAENIAPSAAGVPFLHAAYGFGTIDHAVPAVHAFEDIPAAVRRLSPP